MAMAWIWTIIACFSLAYGVFSGNIPQLGSAAIEGAGAAVKLCVEIAGVTCLWSGVMEVLRRAGIAESVARAFRPLLTRLFGDTPGDSEAMRAISANVSANLLGLGNAATPLGIRATEEMAKMAKPGMASDDMCMLVVLNTASIQLIPATVAAVRASAGAGAPFDILPAVWVTSAASVTAGVIAAKALRRVWRRRGL